MTAEQTPVDFAHTAYAEQARVIKASAIEGVLRAEGIPTDAVGSLPPAARRRVEKAAGIKRAASEETWRKVIWLMEQEDASRPLFRGRG